MTRNNGNNWNNVGLRHLAVVTAIATLVLVLAGGLVTTTESGDDIPTWPTGKLVGYEGAHRGIAAVVGFLVAILAIGLQFREKRGWLRAIGWTALAAVVVQAVLGGLRVHHYAPVVIAIIHATFAQVIFCATTAIALFLSPSWNEAKPDPEVGGAWRLALTTTAFAFLQLVVGAITRHTGAVLEVHLVNAFVLLILASLLVSRLLVTPMKRGAQLLMGLLGSQIVLGFLALYITMGDFVRSADSPLLQIMTVSFHVVLGAAILATCLVTTLRCRRGVAV